MTMINYMRRCNVTLITIPTNGQTMKADSSVYPSSLFRLEGPHTLDDMRARVYRDKTRGINR